MVVDWRMIDIMEYSLRCGEATSPLVGLAILEIKSV